MTTKTESNPVTITVSGKQWKRLRELLQVPHDHGDGMNECAICDESLIDAAVSEITALREKLEKAEKAELDAERYQWLREQDTVPYPDDFYPGELQHLIVFWDGPEELDSAIDQARKK